LHSPPSTGKRDLPSCAATSVVVTRGWSDEVSTGSAFLRLMSKRFYAQRQHIIASVRLNLFFMNAFIIFSKLDILLYQLHALSFFLSPSLFLSFCRLVAQFICSKPRELDPERALRFFYAICLLLNLPSICIHLLRGVVEGRAIILDFIGMCMLFLSPLANC